MAFFLGIDGGGTKTRCLLGDETSILASGSSTSCKVQRVGEACAHDALAAAVHEACVQAGISPGQIIRTCAGITGSGRQEIASIMRKLLVGVVSGEVEIVGDVEVAHADALGRSPGVIVIAGTGSIVYGRNARGETARAGGWGHGVSDEGSGYWIGLEAVKACLRARDREENSELMRQLMRAIGASDADDLIVRVNSNPAPDFAGLFPIVLAAAETDSLAAAILDRAGRELADLTGVVIRRLFTLSGEVRIATHGGVLTSSEQVRKSFCERLTLLCPEATVDSRVIDPARGALQLARRGLSVSKK